jgi:origin recognition complex subunit 1
MAADSISKLATEKAERARQFLKVGGILREDSDDELGFEDYPWEWIYESDFESESDDVEDVENGQAAAAALNNAKSGRNGKAHSAVSDLKKRIVGARMGNFECQVGDCVLLKAEGTNEAWVGLICEFVDDEEEDDEKSANFMWFSSEREIRNKQKKRTDFVEVRCGNPRR